jgi:hypothetical protein
MENQMDKRINLLAQLITENPNQNKSHLYKKAVKIERRIINEKRNNFDDINQIMNAPPRQQQQAQAKQTNTPAAKSGPQATAKQTAGGTTPTAAKPATSAAGAAGAAGAAEAKPAGAGKQTAIPNISTVKARPFKPEDAKAFTLCQTLSKILPQIRPYIKDKDTAGQWYAANGGGPGIVKLLQNPKLIQALVTAIAYKKFK